MGKNRFYYRGRPFVLNKSFINVGTLLQQIMIQLTTDLAENHCCSRRGRSLDLGASEHVLAWMLGPPELCLNLCWLLMGYGMCSRQSLPKDPQTLDSWGPWRWSQNPESDQEPGFGARQRVSERVDSCIFFPLWGRGGSLSEAPSLPTCWGAFVTVSVLEWLRRGRDCLNLPCWRQWIVSEVCVPAIAQVFA